VNTLPRRLCISIGGFFGPCYEVTFKKGRLTIPTCRRGTRVSRNWNRNRNRNARRYSLRPSSGRISGLGSTGSTSGAGKLNIRILASATGPVGPLKSFTQIDRSSRPATTAFRGGTEERSLLSRMGQTTPSRNSVALSPN
jgi:hypothetical protein